MSYPSLLGFIDEVRCHYGVSEADYVVKVILVIVDIKEFIQAFVEVVVILLVRWSVIVLV